MLVGVDVLLFLLLLLLLLCLHLLCCCCCWLEEKSLALRVRSGQNPGKQQRRVALCIVCIVVECGQCVCTVCGVRVGQAQSNVGEGIFGIDLFRLNFNLPLSLPPKTPKLHHVKATNPPQSSTA